MDSLPKRKPNRLNGYDYSQPGYYFVTFCVVDRLPLLRQNMPALCRGAHCAPASGFPPLTYAGKMTDQAIRGIASHYQNITVDKYVIMPNHVHLLLCIRGSENNGRTMCAPTKNVSIAHVIKMLKEVITKSIGYSIWQKGYHDHIIRSESDYLRIWDYIDTTTPPNGGRTATTAKPRGRPCRDALLLYSRRAARCAAPTAQLV